MVGCAGGRGLLRTVWPHMRMYAALDSHSPASFHCRHSVALSKHEPHSPHERLQLSRMYFGLVSHCPCIAHVTQSPWSSPQSSPSVLTVGAPLAVALARARGVALAFVGGAALGQRSHERGHSVFMYPGLREHSPLRCQSSQSAERSRHVTYGTTISELLVTCASAKEAAARVSDVSGTSVGHTVSRWQPRRVMRCSGGAASETGRRTLKMRRLELSEMVWPLRSMRSACSVCER